VAVAQDGDGPTWPGDRGGHVWPKDREAIAPDGTPIRYTVRGTRDGIPIVLCSGFICPDNFWVHLGARLMERHPVVVLNYRGVGASGLPRDPGYRAWRLRPEDFTMQQLAGDVAAVLDAEGLQGAIAMGHSMGVQVALELWRTRPELVAGLILVAGPYGSPLRTFYGTDLASHLFPLVRHGVPMLPRPVQKQVVKALRLPITMPVARLVRALGPHTPDDEMALYRHHFGEVDPRTVVLTAQGMHEHDAGPWLDQIDVPVQVIVGTADLWAPPSIGEDIVAAVPGAELWRVHEGTHGVPIEFPNEIHDVVAAFLHERFDAPAVPPTGRPRVMEGPVTHDELADASRAFLAQ
jgi:3-oxoadipate enol-lactonase